MLDVTQLIAHSTGHRVRQDLPTFRRGAFRDRSLITGRGLHMGGGGASEVLPLQKGGRPKQFRHAEGRVGWYKMFLGSFDMEA